jgi:hypothetical protein
MWSIRSVFVEKNLAIRYGRMSANLEAHETGEEFIMPSDASTWHIIYILSHNLIIVPTSDSLSP